MLSYSWSREE
jgi:hypothetical protein